MLFSQRIGKRPIKTVLQVESIDEDLKVRLWNIILEDFFEVINDDSSYRHSEREEVCKMIWTEFFLQPVDEIGKYSGMNRIAASSVISYIRKWYFEKALWHDIYDFLEFICRIAEVMSLSFATNCNKILEKEVSGYRILGDKVVQLTTEEELQTIEEAIETSDLYKSVNIHLKAALNFLADRKQPNYRNSIKEAISAVESLCMIVTEDDKATLGKALAIIDRKHGLHGSLKTAFNAIYGYTSDTGGIRHAMLEDDVTITFEDAKFMLVSCSAFINYLKAKLGL